MELPYLYENPRRCGFSDFHLLLWAASANHHGLPMAVILIGFRLLEYPDIISGFIGQLDYGWRGEYVYVSRILSERPNGALNRQDEFCFYVRCQLCSPRSNS